jgi:hypothetical protein
VAGRGWAGPGWARHGWAWHGKTRQGFFTQQGISKMIHEKSSDTKILESVLAEAKVGQLITYAELSKAIGRDVRQFAYQSLFSARRCLQNAKRIVFGVQANIGLIRLDDSKIVESTEHDRKVIQRRAKRTIDKLRCAEFDNLTAEEKRRHVTASAQMGAVAMFASKNATKKIAGKVSAKTDALPIGETLRLFGGGVKEETE